MKSTEGMGERIETKNSTKKIDSEINEIENQIKKTQKMYQKFLY